MIADLVRHEATHVEIYEDHLGELNHAVLDGGCETVEPALDAIFAELDRANCEFDLAEYGTARNLSLESCLAG